MRSLISIDDLTDRDLEAILASARRFRRTRSSPESGPPRLLSLVFLETSLRTRVGFTAAAVRLGWRTVEVVERRHSPASMLERWADTLRCVAGYSDAIVARPGQPIGQQDAVIAGPCALINGGDVGPSAQHPSQALIDYFAIEEFIGPVGGLSIAIVGDPRMRAVRSLSALLARRLPKRLTFVADPEHLQELRLPAALAALTAFASWADVGATDVVYVAGIPHGALPQERRDALRATTARTEALPPGCLLLSPMPVIDEMDDYVRTSPRNRMFEQSDLGLFVRMAILEHVTGKRPA
ncbi:MAG: hypothetical protein AB1806_09525 [Acidobacteriota bacterium]